MSRPLQSSVSPAIAVSRVRVCSSDLGWVATAWRGERLYALTFGHGSPQAAFAALGLPAEAPAPVQAGPREAFAKRVRAYAEGHMEDFQDVPITLDGFTDFQRRVLNRCRQIGYGATLTYAQLASGVGSPQAARAVGNTMARNRIPLVIPCHRVVGAGGALGGFSAPAGIAMKRRLLLMESSSKEPE